jgi:U4/U6 small nuclear ribonucleoprotein PRP31
LKFFIFYFKIEEDAYQDAIGFSTGLIGKSGSGKVRAAQVDSKTKAKVSSLFIFFFFLDHH